MISIDLLKPDPNQPRKTFEDLDVLAHNIETQGLIHPIEIDRDNMIIVGERRYRASLLLGLKEVQVTINENDLTPYERLFRQMSENLHQSAAKNGDAMEPIETAKAWVKLYELKTGEEYPISEVIFPAQITGVMDEIIKGVGAKKLNVWRLLQLLNEPEFVQKAIQANKVPSSYVVELNRAPAELKNEFREKMVRQNYVSSRELREEINIVKRFPEEIALISREQGKESKETNRILNGIIRLGLALDSTPFEKINQHEKGIIKNQLSWIQGMVEKYLIENITSEEN